LHHELQRDLVFFAEADQGVEDGFPVFIAREVVVREEVEGNAVFEVVAAYGVSDPLGRAKAHLAALHVDDGAESAFERAPAAAIQSAKIRGHKLAQIASTDGWKRFGVEIWLIVDEIVQRLEVSFDGVTQQVTPSFFDLAFDDGHAVVHELLNVLRNLREQRQIAANVKAANEDGQASAAENAGEIAGAGKLIGLHAYEADDRLGVGDGLRTADALDGNLVDSFVEQMDVHTHVFAKSLSCDDLVGERGQTRQGVAGQDATPVAHHVTIVVVLGRFDEVEMDFFQHFPIHLLRAVPEGGAPGSLYWYHG